MQNTLARPNDVVEQMVEKYGDMLFRISLVMLGNQNDAEDAVQETILKYIQKAPWFDNEEHEKAWLIKVVTNHCKDIKRFWIRHPKIVLEELQMYVSDFNDHEMIDLIMTIPEKFKIVMLLYYVEEYSTEEIAKIIGKSTSAVKMRLQKGRKLLEEKYRKEYL